MMTIESLLLQIEASLSLTLTVIAVTVDVANADKLQSLLLMLWRLLSLTSLPPLSRLQNISWRKMLLHVACGAAVIHELLPEGACRYYCCCTQR